MKECIIWGAGGAGKSLMKKLSAEGTHKVVAFFDNNPAKWGTRIQDVSVLSPEEVTHIHFDKAFVATAISPYEVENQIIGLGVEAQKIDTSYALYPYISRIQWLKNFAQLLKNEPGAVAEAGVFRGDFAKEINACFPSKKLYLFDTFSGFDERDIQQDTLPDQTGNFENTSEQTIMEKMRYPQNCIIKKGYFPESAVDVEDSFCFVNLDMDLYAPTLAGLRFFMPKLTENGLILVHDYYDTSYEESIRRALSEFFAERPNEKYRLLPIGDSVSIAVIKC